MSQAVDIFTINITLNVSNGTIISPLKRITTNGSFKTKETVDGKFHPPEFAKMTTIQQRLHVCEQNIPYVIAIDRNTLRSLGIILAEISAKSTKASHLTSDKKANLQSLLRKAYLMAPLVWNTEPVSLELKHGVKPHPVMVLSKSKFKNEL